MNHSDTNTPRLRTGAQILVDQLVIQGVDRVACVPGESYLAVLDALFDSDIDVLTCRTEGGAAMMADAYGKLIGRPGICMVTRGPGATNASPGVHIAKQDSTPMILFVGQVDSGMREREAFQEIDYKSMFGSIAKWVVEIDRPERVAELVGRAFRVAMQGRPGPVVVSLPEDMLTKACVSADIPYFEPSEPWPSPASMNAFSAALEEAERPIVIVGGSRWSADASLEMSRFAEQAGIAVATSFRRATLFPARHPCYAGDLGLGQDPRLRARVAEADLVILVGGRLSEIPSHSYTLLDVPAPRQKLIHVHPDPDELGRVYAPMLAIEATPAAFCQALSGLGRLTARDWFKQAADANAEYKEWSSSPRTLPGDFQYGEAIAWLRDHLPEDAILCNGAGNYTGWIARYFRYGGFGAQLAPTSGSMGYGVPAAVLAKRQFPDRMVVAVAGDGCFLMNGQEFATAVQFDLPIVVIVVDNGQYGTIRMHQERDYPRRVMATQLKNPDFAAYARAFGGHGENVLRSEEFEPAFKRSVDSGKPSIIHCLVDPRAISHSQDYKPAAELV